MSRTETRCDEYEVEVCENCGHDRFHHQDEPQFIGPPKFPNSDYWAEGCMVIVRPGGRYLRGFNPHPRCQCRKFV